MINSIIYFLKLDYMENILVFISKFWDITVSGAWVLCSLRKNLKLDKHLKNMKHFFL